MVISHSNCFENLNPRDVQYVISNFSGRWPSNYLHCKLLSFLNTFLPGMSIMNLILIALDRMVAIFKPTK